MPLPARHRPAVARALQAAFDVSTCDAITPQSGGLSGAGVYRIEVDGAPYLLRVQDSRDGVRDPARTHACMRIAAEVGVAPRLLYASDEDGVTVTDFVVQRPSPADPAAARAERLPQLGRLVRALHDAPPFPPLVDYLDGLEELVGQVQASRLSSPVLGRTWDGLKDACRRLEPDLVSSHNDLNPGNIVHDGRRPWFVDWDAAFLADRYVDLAALANVHARATEDETVLLEAYFGAPPTAAQSARLFLARQVSHVFHAAIFLSLAAGEKPDAAPPPEDGRSLDDLHRALGGGETLLGRWEGRVAYGLAHLSEAVAGIEGQRFAEASQLAR